MSKILPDLRYTEDHEWVRIDGNVARVGITDYAQDALTDVVYVELPEVGDEFRKGESLGSVESTKSVSDIFAPLSGKVIEVNSLLDEHPELVNEQPFEEGWMVTLEIAEPAELKELLDAGQYKKVLEAH
ncbi:MAG: glycine cleavage system protein GcvH [Thermoplasmatota archaeon]